MVAENLTIYFILAMAGKLRSHISNWSWYLAASLKIYNQLKGFQLYDWFSTNIKLILSFLGKFVHVLKWYFESSFVDLDAL